MKLPTLRRALILVGAGHPVPAARPANTALVGTGARVLPSLYDSLRKRRRRRRLIMALTIGLPTLVASIYYGLVASDRYVSDAQMVLSESGGVAAASAGHGKSSLLSMAGIGGAAAMANEYMIVYQYLTSTEAMLALDRQLGLRRMWGGETVDRLSRLSRDASQEDFLRYFGRRVQVIADPANPVIEVKVEAFTPADAQLIGKTLVALTQDKLNDSYLKMRRDVLGFAQSEVDNAQKALAAVDDKLTRFRDTHGELDPNASAHAVSSVVGDLFGQLASTEADLHTALSYARADSPTVQALKARIAALKSQITTDRRLLAAEDPEGKIYSNLLSAYSKLVLEQQFAQDAYTSAMSFMAASRVNLEQHHTYLIDFLAPSLPQDSTMPRTWKNVLFVFLISGAVTMIGSMVAAAVREHAHR